MPGGRKCFRPRGRRLMMISSCTGRRRWLREALIRRNATGSCLPGTGYREFILIRNFFDYPISLKWETFKNMGFLTTMQAGISYLASVLHKRQENSLEDFYINRFGKKLYSMFFEKYTENLWGRSPREIAPDWGRAACQGAFCHGDCGGYVPQNFSR